MNTEENLTYKEIWNDIVFYMDKNKDKDEQTLQMLLESSILQSLNWKMSKGEVLRPTKKVGSAKFIQPDAILSKDGNRLIVIELKRGYAEFTNDHEEQLFSYMLEFKLQFGILWGRSLCLFYDDILDKEPPRKICDISFTYDNQKGIELIRLLHKDNFNESDFEKYCIDRLEELEKEKDFDKKLKYLCSSEGIEYIKQLLSTEYPKELIERLDIKMADKNKKEIKPITSQPFERQTRNIQSRPEIDDKDYEKRPNETVQVWLQRILMQLFRNNILTEEEIARLHDRQYSKSATGMPYQLLFDTREESFISGQYRSWKYPIGGYYICSQLSNTNAPLHENLIANWLNKILEENKK